MTGAALVVRLADRHMLHLLAEHSSLVREIRLPRPAALLPPDGPTRRPPQVRESYSTRQLHRVVGSTLALATERQISQYLPNISPSLPRTRDGAPLARVLRLGPLLALHLLLPSLLLG